MDPSPQDREALIGWLAEHDDDCPACRYALRGVSEARCPECGTELRLGVRAPDLRLGAWGLALVSFALGLGFDGVAALIVLYGFVISLLFGPMSAEPLIVASVLSLLGAGCLAGILALHRWRARWLCLAWRTQVWSAVGVFLGVGAAHLLTGVVLVGMFVI